MRYSLAILSLCSAAIISLPLHSVLNAAQGTAASEKIAAHPQEAENALGKQAKRIEVVFVLDSTSSMSGMIAGAKERIWSIVNMMSQSADKPQINIGLVSYRDRGDAYICKSIKLTDDLDKMYAYLMDIQAHGGGDTPESVNQGLHEAITDFQWTEDEGAYRIVFLVGDCPPHMDYDNDVSYMKSCELALEKNIHINTVLCGNNAEAKKVWQDIAKRGNGEFSEVQLSGGVKSIQTPHDEKMVDLNKEMDQTRVYLQRDLEKQEDRAASANKQYTSSSAGSLASRAAFNSSAAGADNFLGQNEVVANIESGKLHIKDIKKEELPSALQEKNEDEIASYIKKQSSKRKHIQQEILKLQKQRSQWISENSTQEENSFDVQVKECIGRQLKE